MSFGDKILGGLRSIVLIEERVKRLDETLGALKREATSAVARSRKALDPFGDDHRASPSGRDDIAYCATRRAIAGLGKAGPRFNFKSISA